MPSCSVPGCERNEYCRGWCQRHYKRWWRNGDPLLRRAGTDHPFVACSVPGCGRIHHDHGYCSTHGKRWRRFGTPLANCPIREQQRPSQRVVRVEQRGATQVGLNRWGDPVRGRLVAR